jgi:uncharacterized protein (TIGR01777 family)
VDSLKTVALTGASGFIGQRLIARLLEDGHSLRVLSRTPGASRERLSFFAWDPVAAEPPQAALDGADAVIHLAGEPVGQRWNARVKQRIRDSRVLGTRNLIRALQRASGPRALIAASAIGFYGDRGDEILTEQSGAGRDFLATVCAEWEREAQAAPEGTRVVHLRTGIVLGVEGGALKQMLPVFKAGVGGPVGSGKQWVSWIHIEDAINLITFVLHDRVAGPVNVVAPEPVRNAEFAKALGAALHRPAAIPAPAFGLKLIFGEMAEAVLSSQRVLPRVAKDAGFEWKFPQLQGALRDLLGR